MVNRRLGLVLVVMLAIASAAGAVYANFHFDNLIAHERAAVDAFNRHVQTAHVTLANLRGAQAAYFAVGQGPDFWPARARELAAELEQTVSALQSAASSEAARSHYESAVSALGGLNSLDQKARDDIDIGETRLAADVIFSDSSESAESLASALGTAQTEELIARNARLSDLRRQRLQYASAGVGGVLLMALALAFRRRQAPEQATLPAAEPVVPVAVPAPPVVAQPAAAARVDLSNAAQVCVDLGRVLDGQDIPPILERAARILDAKGLVLWVSDESGAMLRASLAHGYSDKVLQRLGPLQVDADNVTSLAFRSMQVQTLADAKGAATAFAVPLITATGCIGVLAAEVAQGKSSSDAVPIARMFAAQLATLVTPGESAAKAAIAQ
jgi:hypothetical protein